LNRKSAQEFINKNRHCDHGHVTWTDGKEDEFGITLRTEDLMKYQSVYEYIVAKALGWYPERKKEEIKSLRIAG